MKNLLKKETIFGVNKGNLIIYLGCTIGALLIIAGGIVCFENAPSSCADEILFGTGCAVFPTVMVAYLIDFANEKRSRTKIMSYRDSFLWGFPHGVLWLAKQVIECFYNTNEQSTLSFKVAFDLAISVMKNINDGSYDTYCKTEFKKNIKYGLGLITRDTKAIIDNQQMLVMNGVFTMDEIKIMEYALSECTTILSCIRISEMGEYVEILVNELYRSLPEIRKKMDRIAIVENNNIRNWSKIQE